MEILWEIHQQQGVMRAERDASQAKDQASRLRADVEDLKRKTDALTLACQAMWEILREKSGITDAALLQKMEEVDLRDGRSDGKISRQACLCPSCSRRNNTTRTNCVYCGARLEGGHLFEKV